MSKIGLIIKREYLRRVSKKSFILLTFLTPFLFAALVFVPLWLSSIKGDEVHTIAILDSTGKYAPLFEDTETYRFINSDQSMDTYKQIPDKEIFAFLTMGKFPFVGQTGRESAEKNCTEVGFTGKSKSRYLIFQETNPGRIEPARQYDTKEADWKWQTGNVQYPEFERNHKRKQNQFQYTDHQMGGWRKRKAILVRSSLHNRGYFHHAYLYVHHDLWGNGHARGYGRKDEPDHRDHDLVRQTFRLDDGKNYRNRFRGTYTGILMGYHDTHPDCRRLFLSRRRYR